MKLLLIAWHFPPHNNIAAVRIGKLARFFWQQGHDIRVLTPRKNDADRSLAVEIPDELVISTDWIDVDRIAHPITHMRREREQASQNSAPVKTRRGQLERGIRQRIAGFYNSIFFFPDRHVGWYPKLIGAGDALIKEWRPDAIYVTGPPFSIFLGARHLAKKHDIPWFAEFRDRWVDDNYFPPPPWRRAIDFWLERNLVEDSAGIVTVSPPWVDLFAQKYNLPVALAFNGFAAEDFPDRLAELSPGPVRLLHMGTIYPGRRNPGAIFEAITRSGLTPEDIRLEFYGTNLQIIANQAEEMGVSQFIKCNPPVPYRESIEIQRSADLLMLLQWNDPSEQGNVPAKLFEYFAVRRPILGVGLENGVPARMIAAREAGLFTNDPDRIAEHLRQRVAEKRETGAIAALGSSVRDGLSRDEQYRAIETLVSDATRAPRIEQLDFEPVAELIRTREFRQADTKVLEKPVLCMIIDAEEDFDWRKPFSRHSTGVDSMDYQHLAHEIFDRYGIIPTYLIDYPVATNVKSATLLRRLLDEERIEIGAQMHPWVNPPHEGVVSERNSFTSNLPRDLARRKIEVLTEVIEKNYGIKPRVYKAGRFGLDLFGARMIEELGYQVDTSVVPYTTYHPRHGADFRGLPDRPFWFGVERPILELPISRSLTGPLGRRLGDRMVPAMDFSLPARLKIPGIMARAGLAERITLTPEGIDHQAHRRLVHSMLTEGHKVFCFSYHSSSLAPGNTPYVRDESDLKEMLKRIDQFLDFFFNEVGGTAATPMQLHRALSEQRQDPAEKLRATG